MLFCSFSSFKSVSSIGERKFLKYFWVMIIDTMGEGESKNCFVWLKKKKSFSTTHFKHFQALLIIWGLSLCRGCCLWRKKRTRKLEDMFIGFRQIFPPSVYITVVSKALPICRRGKLSILASCIRSRAFRGKTKAWGSAISSFSKKKSFSLESDYDTLNNFIIFWLEKSQNKHTNFKNDLRVSYFINYKHISTYVIT